MNVTAEPPVQMDGNTVELKKRQRKSASCDSVCEGMTPFERGDGGKGGIRTHVPHLWDNSISSRARCDRFDTFPLRRRPDQPARQAFGPSYEKTHISLCASFLEIYGVSKQIRTALSDVRGRCPNRIDDGDVPHV